MKEREEAKENLGSREGRGSLFRFPRFTCFPCLLKRINREAKRKTPRAKGIYTLVLCAEMEVDKSAIYALLSRCRKCWDSRALGAKKKLWVLGSEPKKQRPYRSFPKIHPFWQKGASLPLNTIHHPNQIAITLKVMVIPGHKCCFPCRHRVVGWFLLRKFIKFWIWHAAMFFPLLHWFQNCFCFRSGTFPSHVGTFFAKLSLQLPSAE